MERPEQEKLTGGAGEGVKMEDANETERNTPYIPTEEEAAETPRGMTDEELAAVRAALPPQSEEQEPSAKQALFDLFAPDIREANFFYAQSATASRGLMALGAGDIEGAKEALHILHMGAAHKLATQYSDAPYGDPIRGMDQAATEATPNSSDVSLAPDTRDFITVPDGGLVFRTTTGRPLLGLYPQSDGTRLNLYGSDLMPDIQLFASSGWCVLHLAQQGVSMASIEANSSGGVVSVSYSSGTPSASMSAAGFAAADPPPQSEASDQTGASAPLVQPPPGETTL